MKQHITIAQYAELTDAEREHILAFAEQHGCDFLLSIGHMIEFLKEQEFRDGDRVCYFSKIFWSYLRTEWVVRFEDGAYEGIEEFNADELCDALWDGVKEALNQHYGHTTTNA